MQPIPAQAVIFDKDGTLLDFHATWGPSFAALLRNLCGGDEALLEDLARAMAIDIDAGRIDEESPLVAQSTGEIAVILAPLLGRSDVATLAVQVDEMARQESSRFVTPIAGAAETVTGIRLLGLPVGLATNDAEATARDQLDALGLAPDFDVVLGYDSGHGAKPHPGMLLHAADALGVNIESLVMVGDTPTDVGAAVAAGCPCVLIDPDRRFGTPADVVVDSLAEVAGVIRAMA